MADDDKADKAANDLLDTAADAARDEMERARTKLGGVPVSISELVALEVAGAMAVNRLLAVLSTRAAPIVRGDQDATWHLLQLVVNVQVGTMLSAMNDMPHNVRAEFVNRFLTCLNEGLEFKGYVLREPPDARH